MHLHRLVHVALSLGGSFPVPALAGRVVSRSLALV
jgi:hypothetical protein